MYAESTKIFVSGIHLHFKTSLKISFWNPGTYRHKIVRLSSAQFGLVMIFLVLSNFVKFFYFILLFLYYTVLHEKLWSKLIKNV